MSHSNPLGQLVTVKTNCFAISTLPTKDYIQYDVSFDPECKFQRKRQELVARLQNELYPSIFHPRGIYDGNAIMYVSRPFNFEGNHLSQTFWVADRPNVGAKPGARGTFQLIFKRTQSSLVRPSILGAFVTTGQQTQATAVAVNLLQLLIRQHSDLGKPHNNRAHFSQVGFHRVSGGIELWRGYFQSVRPTLGRMLINIDTAMTAMYQRGSLIDVALAFISCSADSSQINARDLCWSDHPLRSGVLVRLEKFLLGVRITVAPKHDRIKTMKGLSKTGAANFMFTNREGDRLSVKDYFERVHNTRISQPHAMTVYLTSKDHPSPAVVPMECCKVIEGQMYRKKLPDKVVGEAVKFSALNPKDRLAMIDGSWRPRGSDPNRWQNPIKGYGQSEYIADSGMVVDPQPVQVKGTLLPPPSLRFQGSSAIRPNNGAWNVMGQRFHEAAPMPHWAVLNFCNVEWRPFVDKLLDSCKNLGMSVSDSPVARVNGNGQNVPGALQDIFRQITGKLKPNDRPIIFVLLPQSAEAIRTRIKHWGDCQAGFITQCIRENKFLNGKSQYWNNVALKVNARLRGCNFVPNTAVFEQVQKSPFMIMGADVGHPGPGVMRPSIASLVFSWDRRGAKYAATTKVQPPRVEQIQDLREMVKYAFQAFHMRNGKVLPASIVFYRDGLSEGEFQSVGNWEIGEIQGAVNDYWQSKEWARDKPKPKLTFMVVGKRHHICFFPDTPGTSDNSGNVVAGFATNEGELRNPLVPDFYLQSHAAIQGTSRSSHYIVLRDDNCNFNTAPLKELSYTLCHIYAKATRSVSIPAPVYYADLVCSRAVFHFNPDAQLTFDGSDSASSTSSGGTPSFDLELWKNAFKKTNSRVLPDMYFL